MARDYFRQRRVPVTGGAGFVGSPLCDRLIAAGNEVLCVDNLLTGTRRNIKTPGYPAMFGHHLDLEIQQSRQFAHRNEEIICIAASESVMVSWSS